MSSLGRRRRESLGSPSSGIELNRIRPMPKIDDRIEALEAKLKQLKVQHQRKEARARTVAGEEIAA
jgi:hypothetical protein